MSKKTRVGLTDKTIGEELLIDIEKYSVHPDCKKLYCFMYDSCNYIVNPAA